MHSDVESYLFAIETLVRIPIDNKKELEELVGVILADAPPNFAETFISTTEYLEMDGVFPCGELRAAWYFFIKTIYPTGSVAEALGIEPRARIAGFNISAKQLSVWKKIFHSKIVRGNPYRLL